MINRIQQYGENLPLFITLNECKDGILADNYAGAGAAIIICNGDAIIDLVYFESDQQIAEIWRAAVMSRFSVYFGICSCYALCDVIDITKCKDSNHAIQTMVDHAKEKQFMEFC